MSLAGTPKVPRTWGSLCFHVWVAPGLLEGRGVLPAAQTAQPLGDLPPHQEPTR